MFTLAVSNRPGLYPFVFSPTLFERELKRDAGSNPTSPTSSFCALQNTVQSGDSLHLNDTTVKVRNRILSLVILHVR